MHKKVLSKKIQKKIANEVSVKKAEVHLLPVKPSKEEVDEPISIQMKPAKATVAVVEPSEVKNVQAEVKALAKKYSENMDAKEQLQQEAKELEEQMRQLKLEVGSELDPALQEMKTRAGKKSPAFLINNGKSRVRTKEVKACSIRFDYTKLSQLLREKFGDENAEKIITKSKELLKDELKDKESTKIARMREISRPKDSASSRYYLVSLE
jgi:hypothetical protein